jgi:hypothetical protein
VDDKIENLGRMFNFDDAEIDKELAQWMNPRIDYLNVPRPFALVRASRKDGAPCTAVYEYQVRNKIPFSLMEKYAKESDGNWLDE